MSKILILLLLVICQTTYAGNINERIDRTPCNVKVSLEDDGSIVKIENGSKTFLANYKDSISENSSPQISYFIDDNCNVHIKIFEAIISGNSFTFQHYDFKKNIDKTNKEEVRSYPNPSNYIINISGLAGMEDLTFKIYDISGKLMLTDKVDQQSINVSALISGNYILEIFDKEDVKILNEKIIIK